MSRQIEGDCGAPCGPSNTLRCELPKGHRCEHYSRPFTLSDIRRAADAFMAAGIEMKLCTAVVGRCVRCHRKYGVWVIPPEKHAVCPNCHAVQTGLAVNPFDFGLSVVHDQEPDTGDLDSRQFVFRCGCRLDRSAWFRGDSGYEESTSTVCSPEHRVALASTLAGSPEGLLGDRITSVRRLRR